MPATCETCRWWGDVLIPATDVAPEYRRCEWPAPPYLKRDWGSPGSLNTCVVHQPKEPGHG